jgi:hypothetical protein
MFYIVSLFYFSIAYTFTLNVQYILIGHELKKVFIIWNHNINANLDKFAKTITIRNSCECL